MDVHNFPAGFLWGASISAHQTEGNNINSDWWKWEQNKKDSEEFPRDASNEACDFYNRYEKDFKIAVDHNLNAIRLSIEWARIEPTHGTFSNEAITHYQELLKNAQSKGLKTFVTLHHFTNPQWFAQKGGWTYWNSPHLFEQYAKLCAEKFAEYVDSFITLNEPQVFALKSYTDGTWPPNKRNVFLSFISQVNMMRAHKKAYRTIKNVCNAPIGISKQMVWYETDPTGSHLWDKATAWIVNFLNDDFYLVPLVNTLDFIGLNYYFTKRIRNFKDDSPTDYVSDMGWWINPPGLTYLLHKLKKYNVPLYITENGLADSTDKYRTQFIRDMLMAVGQAQAEGCDVRGYFHWSLMDNYEWHEGFWPRFGLVEIDRGNDLERIPRPSFDYYSKVCKENRVTVH